MPGMSDEVPEAVRAVAVTREELPTLALDLPDGEPTTVRRVAALLVVASALFRSSWPEEIEMSVARSRAMRRDEPKAGETSATGDAVLVDVVNARTCLLCGGRGTVDASFPSAPQPCGDCDGTGQLVTAKVKMVADELVTLHDVLIPTELRTATGMLSLERIIEGSLPGAPDETFRCHDLRKVAEVSAYRGAQRQQDPTFFGWSFEDTIEQGGRAVDAFLQRKGKRLVADIRAFAWPLLWLRYPRPEGPPVEVVVFRDVQGAVRRVRSDEGEAPAPLPG